jgi:hypothetical protein
MKRRLSNALVAGPLCLTLLAIPFWIHSYWRNDTISYLGRSLIDLNSCSGTLVFSRRTCRSGWLYPGTFEFHAYDDLGVLEFPKGTSTQFLGAGYWKDIDGWISIDNVAIPYWMITGLAVILLMATLVRRMSQKDPYKGTVCTTCGYDLRATPHRCPECGTIPIKNVITST